MKKEHSEDSTRIPGIQESISFEQQYLTKDSIEHGPVIPYYFHEIAKSTTFPKRLLDLTAAIILLTLFMALYVPIAMIIKTVNGGKVITRIDCPGYRGLLFQRYLFNTGRKNGVEDHPSIFNKVLKSTGLNCLPQIFNIFKGEMSLVGPHPYSKAESLTLNDRFRDFYKRYAANPGMISPRPKHARHRFSEQHDEHYIELFHDLQYIRKHSGLGDLKVLLRKVTG